MTWESVASLGTGMASDGDGGECYRIEKLGWVSKKIIIILEYEM